MAYGLHAPPSLPIKDHDFTAAIRHLGENEHPPRQILVSRHQGVFMAANDAVRIPAMIR